MQQYCDDCTKYHGSIIKSGNLIQRNDYFFNPIPRGLKYNLFQSLTLVVAVKTNHPPKDLEGAPTRGAGEISTLTRTTGREIDLLLDNSAAETVISRATGMTITVEVAVVNRSK